MREIAFSAMPSTVNHEALLEADGFKLVVRASRYERPDAEEYWDANWVSGEVEMQTSRGGRFSARTTVSLFTSDLVSFVAQLRRLDEALVGEATLAHFEDEFGATIRLDSGRGTLSAFVRAHVEAELRVEEVPIDQSYIRLDRKS